MTLIELMVALAIGAVIMTALLSFSIYTSRSLAGVYNYMDLENQSRAALDRMTREIRQVNRIASFATNSISFTDSDGKLLSFSYAPSSRTLVRTKDGQTETLLRGCDVLQFQIYQRNATNGTYDNYPTSLQESNAKVVQVSWVCSRRVIGTSLNTESVQMAKIVVRNN